MAKRYELDDASWEMIEDFIAQDQETGRPRSNDRLMLNGVLWVMCSGAAWRNMPERFGPWSTVYNGFETDAIEARLSRCSSAYHQAQRARVD